jgi:hypothetical protein
MHWYTWALLLWAMLSGIPALAVLLFLLPTVVARRISESIAARIRIRSPHLRRKPWRQHRVPVLRRRSSTDQPFRRLVPPWTPPEQQPR